ncbi:MAG TPA: alpha-galactosidase [Firmicutes bacterium]|nr:alpha-galactosidase [Bacillota bacterium]
MISARDNVFRLDTENTSYLFRVTKFGHLEHLYYGPLLAPEESIEVLAQKRVISMGNNVVYDETDESYSLDQIYLEWSDNGRGDYRQSPTELKMPDSTFVSDFVYVSHQITDGSVPMYTLPSAYGGDQTLVLTMQDTTLAVTLSLYYTVFVQANVITRRAVLTNESPDPLVIRRMMSMMVDLPDEHFYLYTLDGKWIKEAHLHRRPVEYGMMTNASTTGASSNRHNPAFMLAAAAATEENGHVYGFNLIYSGNHASYVEKSGWDMVRVLVGINPHCFEWNLAPGESFETPEAVMTFSNQGFNGMSRNMHSFVNEHIVRGNWKQRERPVLINSWEAYYFDYDEGKLIQLAKKAKDLGIELFVLDDGWFGARNNDQAALGDYTVNKKKFPRGLKVFADQLRELGLEFGLWVEPEMVNPDSDLFREHPAYAVRHPMKKPVLGRNQLVLDLCQKEVRDYIVEQVSQILDEAKVSYVKWDMNRHIAEACSAALTHQGEFYHRYIIGLYEVLSRIFRPRPEILLESCSSGGNRFDLGMLCFSPQIWTSDDTDPIERLKIQSGLSYFYPLSTMGAHVSQSPNQQTLRATPLSTRFNVACFGCLGYELDLKYLTPEEKKEIKAQIAFYKKYRRLFQYGVFSRLPVVKENQVIWQCISAEQNMAATGFFQTLAQAAESEDRLTVKGLKAGKYVVRSRPQRLALSRFGGLVNHISPVELNPDGFLLRQANRYYSLPSCLEEYQCSAAALSFGIPLNNQFTGTGYNQNVRMLGDFGSTLYITEELKREGEENA